jgi:flavin reductase (DIM6/NTAB) family NADH-FMN oxidoreductase RutF
MLMNETIGAVLGQIPSGLFILSARNSQGDETGMLASWVQQAAFDPPAITVAVNRQRYLHDWLVPGAAIALSQVAESQKQLLGHFGRGFEPGVPAFEKIDILRTPRNLAVLADAIGWMEGTIASSVDAADHTVYLVQLSTAGAGKRFAQERPWVHIRKNGLSY